MCGVKRPGDEVQRKELNSGTERLRVGLLKRKAYTSCGYREETGVHVKGMRVRTWK